MKTQKITYILIFLILVNCVKGKTKENDPTEEALTYLRILAPTDDRMTKEKLSEVDGFYLRDTAITDDKLKYILIFPNLEDLALTKTKISDEGLATLQNNKIRHLDIDSTLITNKAIKVLRDWKHLEILNISYTNIDDGALEDILKLKIGRLEAAGTKLSEKAKERIRKKMQFEDEDYEL
ncbi:hypothetical protein [Leptospira weilii]|uniref:hypothetical protein n=1 Tax=Leptospira weilii TaxID=28184 RepID=UPI0005689A3D|nr:hypothetical protein [Leptospira weilii]QDK26091.1 hypothetical protein FHG68_04795 [Leptospira weilii]